MGKISPVSAKYIVNATIRIDGIVDRPDVIGAIFGQTEGLLGSDLELRELQRSGRVGRIEVKTDTKTGKTEGGITIPSSMDKAETAVIGAALETIQRIGPCNASVKVENIEDVRVTKRSYVIERAKELLKTLNDNVLPDSQEITEEVAQSVKMMEVSEYGPERLAAGPAIDESDEIIVVEGRADVLNLLKQGIKNAICIDGTSVPETIQRLSKKKDVVAFLDGDRGGDLILRELLTSCAIDYVVRAPDGKEVEELAKKEIHKALRSRVTVEQVKLDLEKAPLPASRPQQFRHVPQQRPPFMRSPPRRNGPPQRSFESSPSAKPKVDTVKLKDMLEGMVGSRGACILDENLQVLGKVPVSELETTLDNLPSSYAVVLDGAIDSSLVSIAERRGVAALAGMDSKVKSANTRLLIITSREDK